MPLNSVQLYVKDLLDGLQIPGQSRALRAYVTPPTFTDLNGPVAFVWNGRMRGNRQTMPRINNAVITGRSGFKMLNWIVDVYLSYETVPNSDGLDQEFPLLVDAVLMRTWTTTMPTVITDPTTQLVSQVLSIGEDFEMDMPPEKTPATQRMLYYTTKIGFNIQEAVQA